MGSTGTDRLCVPSPTPSSAWRVPLRAVGDVDDVDDVVRDILQRTYEQKPLTIPSAYLARISGRHGS